MVWDFVDFIKKIVINVVIHICWLLLYVLIDMIELTTDIIFVDAMCKFLFRHKPIFAVICALLFNYIICKVYKKNPCTSVMGKCIYWILSVIQTYFLCWLLFE